MTVVDKVKQWRARVWGYNTYCRNEWVAKEAAAVPPRSRVLDVGAGHGQYRTLFAHCDYRTHDFAQERNTQYTKLDYESDITAIPAPDESFDVILCTEVLEHVPEPIVALHEMVRLAKPGGRLLLTAPLGSWLHQEPYHFYGGYTPYWYQRFLGEANCDIESLVPNEGFFSYLGSEAQRFRLFTHPKQTRHVPWPARGGVMLLWIASIPGSHIVTLLGHWLDRLNLQTIATTGYHVKAVKRPRA